MPARLTFLAMHGGHLDRAEDVRKRMPCEPNATPNATM